jgi:hypothetical protein
MAVDSFSSPSDDVLNDLDPLSRALLDLSLQRGMEDAEIANVLGTDEESVLEVRVGLLRALADKVAPEHAEDDVPELQAVIADRLYGDEEGQAEEVAELEAAVPEREAEPEPEPDADPLPKPVVVRNASRQQEAQPKRRRSPLVFLLPLLLVAVVAAIVVFASSGGGSDDKPAAPTPPPPPSANQKPDKPAEPSKPAPP